ncbi:MAG: hypothetical protein ABIH41_04970 [Nanoarchaeota archaeon]
MDVAKTVLESSLERALASVGLPFTKRLFFPELASEYLLDAAMRRANLPRVIHQFSDEDFTPQQAMDALKRAGDVETARPLYRALAKALHKSMLGDAIPEEGTLDVPVVRAVNLVNKGGVYLVLDISATDEDYARLRSMHVAADQVAYVDECIRNQRWYGQFVQLYAGHRHDGQIMDLCVWPHDCFLYGREEDYMTHRYFRDLNGKPVEDDALADRIAGILRATDVEFPSRD